MLEISTVITRALPLVAALLLGGNGMALALGEKFSIDIKSRDGRDLGKARLTETISGVLVRIHVKGLTPGPHAVHLHEVGKCEGGFDSAGGIVNPLGNRHGFLNEDGPMAGDLPNILVPTSGEVEVEILAPFVTTVADSEDTLLDADGSALVIFEKADDYATDPAGNAGGRIGCGVIVPAK